MCTKHTHGDTRRTLSAAGVTLHVPAHTTLYYRCLLYRGPNGLARLMRYTCTPAYTH